VLKHSASSELLAALNELQKESIYISPQLDCNVGDLMKIHASKRSGSLIELTDRQREVLQLLAEGCSAKEAAAVLNTSPRTVEYHKYRLMDMLEIDSSAKLVQYAIKQGIASGIS
jgi:DNA-binding NarL/FixJ family response regulator